MKTPCSGTGEYVQFWITSRAPYSFTGTYLENSRGSSQLKVKYTPLIEQVNQWTPFGVQLLPVVTPSNSDKTHVYSNLKVRTTTTSPSLKMELLH